MKKKTERNKLKIGGPASKQLFLLIPKILFLDKDGIIISDDLEKANVLNNYFRDQTYIDDTDVELPNIANYTVQSDLTLIPLTPN